MEITYIGRSCFKIKGKDTTIVIDPYNPENTKYKLPRLDADILLLSHAHPDHNHVDGVTGYKLLVDTPGEYEVGGTFIYGLETFHDDKEGKERGKNIMFLIDIDGMTVLHAGDLGHELSAETLEKISDVDVLILPVGGVYTIDAKTAGKIISSIEPSYVIPMHYNDGKENLELEKLDIFLKEMGVEGSVKPEDRFKLNSKSESPEDTQVLVLTPQH
ncbi:MAG TPA: MBL fold metallo-hydrolase [Candidatus Saccharimonadales bacterium]|nr:MBL fold metallo-hydrolase [Candidatus Saccharimonadales bacterium]